MVKSNPTSPRQSFAWTEGPRDEVLANVPDERFAQALIAATR
jgi:hypothetical protein